VSTHLATCPNCLGKMDVTDEGPFTRVRCPGCGDEVRVKTEMGGYRLVRRVAFGGMSVVYVARDPTLDREIAVKVLSEDYSADRKREEQFEREAKLTAAVSHPNVVRVFTVGRAFDRFFIAMELVSGQSLEQRMSVHGALPEDDVISLALQVVEGLRAAKGAGLIHRDIKPGNILIDDNGTAKIVDFGLSLLAEGGPLPAEALWATPDYVAPEALEHAGEDHRSDIYALGATLYHALSGISPIETKEISTRALRQAKRNVPPLKKAAPWLSSEVVRIVEKAMAHNPAKRFDLYEEFHLSLETAREVLEARGQHFPVHGAVRAQRRERQKTHRRAWLAGGTALAVLFATATAFLVGKIRNSDRADEGPAGPVPVIVPGSDPTLDPESAMEINAAYEGARQALAEDDFVVAEQQFMRVWHHEDSPVPTAAWAGFEATVAAYLDGRSGDARQHLADLLDFLVKKRGQETKLGRRLLSSIEVLTALSFVPEERVPKLLDDPFRATAFFAMALKLWEQGQLERAHGMFERLSHSGPWPETEWMEVYQELAGRYVVDYRQLGRADHSMEGKNRAEVQAAIEELDEIYTSLQTRGRARFNVKVWQTELMRRLRELRERRVAPHWKELRDEITREFAEAKFPDGVERLKAARPKGELEQKQRAALVDLAEAAGAFLVDLERALAPGATGVDVRTRKGEQFTQIIGSQEGGLLVEEKGAARSLGWGEVDPVALLLLHRKLVETAAELPQKDGLLFHSAAFAWLHGLHAEAEGVAKELIELKPSFAAEWEQIKEVLGEG